MTTQTQHTPGPWKIESGVNIIADRKMLGIVNSDGIKAFAYPEHARLIAAAPDLLAALETIALHCPSLDVVGIRAYCDAAIAKATGVQS